MHTHIQTSAGEHFERVCRQGQGGVHAWRRRWRLPRRHYPRGCHARLPHHPLQGQGVHLLYLCVYVCVCVCHGACVCVVAASRSARTGCLRKYQRY